VLKLKVLKRNGARITETEDIVSKSEEEEITGLKNFTGGLLSDGETVAVLSDLAGGVGNIDCGTPESVYLESQVIDCGGI